MMQEGPAMTIEYQDHAGNHRSASLGSTDVHLVNTPIQNTTDPDWNDLFNGVASSGQWLSYKTDTGANYRMCCHCQYIPDRDFIKTWFEHDAPGDNHEEHGAYILDWDNQVWTVYLENNIRRPYPHQVTFGLKKGKNPVPPKDDL